jgi:DNA-binding SARP family transcriptional activator
MVRMSVLGPLRTEVAGEPVDLGSPRQRAVLARLVSAGGHVVPTDRFVDDLWRSEPPPKALAALQVYVSNLRRILEPDRRPRTPSTVLVSVAPGYALRLAAADVDAWRFESLVEAAGAALTGSQPQRAAALLDEALALWSGSAYAEFADEPWAAPEAARLEELRLVAVEQRGAAALALGRHAQAVPQLEQHVQAHPLREEAVRLLALALYRSGRQGDALAVLRRTRELLVDELGVDPGPRLRAIEADILAQAPVLDAPPATALAAIASAAAGLPAATAGPPAATAGPPAATAGPPTEGAAAPTRLDVAVPVANAAELNPLVGRAAELSRLDAAAGRVGATGFHAVWLGGEAGAGKSALAEAFARRRADLGWRVALGRCPEVPGAPPAWAWSEVLRGLSQERPPAPELAQRLAPLLDEAVPPSTSQFWLARALGEYLADVAAAAPLLIVLDDAHRADSETLQLLRYLAAELAARPVLVLATHRGTEATDELAATWAALAGRGTEHLDLAGLDAGDVAELLSRYVGDGLDEATTRLVTERTSGNPLFVNEMARLIAAEGAGAARAVPAGVRDVLRRRLARLPARAQTVLRNAAVIGREVDVDVLLAMTAEPAAGNGEDDVLDGLEFGVLTGLLAEPAPGQVRFTHALVRDTLYEDTPRLRLTRLHGRVLTAMEQVRPQDVAGLAHHALAAATPATAHRATGYAAAAARQASRLYAHREAAELWAGALRALDAAGEAANELRLEVLCGLVSACGHAGNVVGARASRADAMATARRLGDPLAMARALTAYNAPVTWTFREDRRVDQDAVRAIGETLADLPAGEEALRCRLLATLAFELEGDDDAATDRASRSALDLARRVDDAELICVGLNARYFAAMAPDRTAELPVVGAELLATATAAGLLGYQVLAHHALFQEALRRNDLATAGWYVDRAVEHSTTGQLGLSLGVLALFDALRDLIAGEFDAAEAKYTLITRRMTEQGAVNGEAAGLLGRFVVAVAKGNTAALLPEILPVYERLPEQASDFLTRAYVDAGRIAEARATWRPDDPIRPDYFWLLWKAMRAQNAVLLGDPAVGAECYAALTPWAGELAGGNGSVTLGPVDQILGDLALLLGHPDAAAAHYAAAAKVAEQVGSPHWTASAVAAGGALGERPRSEPPPEQPRSEPPPEQPEQARPSAGQP